MREYVYRLIRWFVARGLHIYFSRIEFVGLENIPKDKPFILAVNHQNAFLDALLAGILIPFHFHFLTRSDVFTRWSSYILKTFKMTPIYRMRDGFDQLGKNEEVFDNCTQLFREKKAILVFSEGNHGEHYYLRPLTKGTSRIALESQVKLDEELFLVPCGLNFFSHRTPRTKLISVYGKPISVREFQSVYEKDKQDGLKKLKDRLAAGMKECLIIPDKTPDYEMKVRKVFNPQNEVLSFKKLREMASRDYSKDETVFVKTPKTSFQKSMLMMTSIPNFGPLLLLKRVLKIFKDKVFWASMKFIVMLLAMPFWWVILFFTGYFIFGFWEGVVLVFLSVLGLFVRAELVKE